MEIEPKIKNQPASAKLTALRWLIFIAIPVIFYFVHEYFPASPSYLISAVFGCLLQIGSVLYLNRRKPEWGQINIVIGYMFPIIFQVLFRPDGGIYRSLNWSQELALLIQYFSAYGLTLIPIVFVWNYIVTSRDCQDSA